MRSHPAARLVDPARGVRRLVLLLMLAVMPAAAMAQTPLSPPNVSPQGDLYLMDVAAQNPLATFWVYNSNDVADNVSFTCSTIGIVGTCTPPASVVLEAFGGSATVAVPFTLLGPGNGELRLTAQGGGGYSGGWIRVSASRLIPVVTPKGDQVAAPPLGAATQRFTVKNTGGVGASYALSTTCTGVSACSVASPLSVGAGQSADILVNYTGGAAGAAGTIELRATSPADPSATDAGSVAVTMLDAPPLQNPAIAGPGTERRLCVTVTANADAAYECGDLRLTHALPTIRTKGKSRTPVLLYSSQVAHPYPLVAADVPIAAPTPTNVQATLVVGGVTRATATWAGTDWGAGGTRHVTVGYDAGSDPTGIYDYRLDVQRNDAGVLTTVVAQTDQLIVVNRSASVFGPGWWLAGLDQLVPTGANKLFVGGDGSSRLYTQVAGRADMWAAPQVDAQDYVKLEGSFLVRYLPGGVRVAFDAATGLHRYTINRIGDTTSFAWDPGCSRLTGITVPVSATPTSYQFNYAAGGCTTGLESVVLSASAVATRRTTLTWPTPQALSITDPDLSSVRFEYDPIFLRRINRRVNRRGFATSFGYDAGNKLAQTTIEMPAPQAAIVTGYTAAETRGLAGSPARDASLVYTQIQGPRNVGDSTLFWLNRFGAPTRIRNALGFETTIDRGDARWPALATAVTDARGFARRASYDVRGHVVSTTAVNPLNDLRDATTQYEWDVKWDAVTRIAQPTGEVVSLAYDPVTSNRLWQQPGLDEARRTTFGYDPTSRLLTSIQLPAPTPPATARVQSFLYDARGNLSESRTPLNYMTRYERDDFGREIVRRRQIDVSATPAWQDDSTQYDDADRPVRHVSYGPPVGTIGAQRIIVRNSYNAEGQVDSLKRVSAPDAAGVDTMRTFWRYDATGRRVAEQTIDGVDSTQYDPAGNPTVIVTRRRHTIVMTYDALNRLAERTVPAHSYAAWADRGIATNPGYNPSNLIGVPPGGSPKKSYPRYSNDAAGGWTISGDTERFTYDPMNNITAANNGDAQVSRTYYPNGLLQTETERIRTYDGADFATHAYTVTSTYDLSGRRIALQHPTQLAPTAGRDTERYTYDAVTGALTTVTDLLGNQFDYRYNARGEPDTLIVWGAYRRATIRDADGRLANDYLWRGAGLTVPYRQVTLGYDARDLLVSSSDATGWLESLSATNSGLGYLASTNFSSRARYGSDIGTYTSQESHDYDGLGNRTSSNTVTTFGGPGLSRRTSTPVSYQFQRGTGRQTGATSAVQADALTYDEAGNTVFSYQSGWTMNAVLEDRASFYGADGRLRAADFRRLEQPMTVIPPARDVFEEYRYDALGRRVLVRARAWCDNVNTSSGVAGCRVSTIRRLIWDGDNEADEIQMPGGDGVAVTTLENDTGLVDQQNNGPGSWDTNAFYGRVAYTRGLVADEPLSITRTNYRNGWYAPSVFDFPPFALLPFWNARGVIDDARFGGGTYNSGLTGRDEYCLIASAPTQFCNPTDCGSTLNRCVGFTMSNAFFAYDRPRIEIQAWQGSLWQDKKDGAGTLYRRNRVYDPATGRFTQEDPIGLAGGLNLYGFANSNPLSYSDPFGLCPPEDDEVCSLRQQVVDAAKATGRALLDRVGDAGNTLKSAFGWVGKQLAIQGGFALATEGAGPVIGTGLRAASPALRALFAEGSLSGASIIGIRSTLLEGGFTQSVTRNGAGYLFRNSAGEEVRLMSRAGGWDARIMNKFGNYLDEFGNVAERMKSHGISIFSK